MKKKIKMDWVIIVGFMILFLIWGSLLCIQAYKMEIQREKTTDALTELIKNQHLLIEEELIKCNGGEEVTATLFLDEK